MITLPPKKKGRKKKGEVDTETEEEKALRGGEAAEKSRERRAFASQKARMVAELEQRAETAEARVVSLETEVAKLKREVAAWKGGAGGGSGGRPRPDDEMGRTDEAATRERTSSAIWNGRALDECDRGVFGRTASNRPLVQVLRTPPPTPILRLLRL